MEKINGNTNCILKYYTTKTNAIGEGVKEWVEYITLKDGFLDMLNYSKEYVNYNKATAESTNVFICDYVSIDKKPEELRATINGVDYDVTFIDDPMGLHYHLEVFLKAV